MCQRGFFLFSVLIFLSQAESVIQVPDATCGAYATVFSKVSVLGCAGVHGFGPIWSAVVGANSRLSSGFFPLTP